MEANVGQVAEPDARALDEFFGSVLHTEDDALAGARRAGEAAGLPEIEVSAQHGKLLTLLAIATGANNVLEIGTLAGYSTICLARGVGAAGRVVTLECESRHAQVAQANFDDAGVSDRVEVIVGAALDILPTLIDRAPFDLIFIDADKENNVAYLDWAIRLGRPGSVIVIDNIARMGRVLEPAADDHQARAVRDTLVEMGRNPRLEAAAVQTVGTKGWDGFAVALVT